MNTVKTIPLWWRKKAFDYSLERALAWLHKAYQFKSLAEKIDPYNERYLEDMELWEDEDKEILMLADVYLFLMGLSFENLIKGIAIAQGTISPVVGGKLNPDLTKHDLRELLGRIEGNQVPLSQEQRELIECLKPYVVWAGRYPVPKKPGDFSPNIQVFSEETIERNRKRLAVWDRLAVYLLSLAG